MSALNEKPNAETLPASSGGAILQDGHYLAPPEDADGKVWVRTTALVQGTPQDLYALWRQVEKAPLWQEHVEEVVVTGVNTSTWTMKYGEKVHTSNSQILADEPGKRIAWSSVDTDPHEAGEVIFEPATGDRGTFVILLMEFRRGKLAAAWESLLGRSPKQRVIEDLRHFKAFAETGEIPHSQTAPHGDRGLIGGMKRSLYGENVPTPAGAVAR
ncbi:SRPBCC family protein [Granulicella cerasi]|uniref:SRPBCC family protein n=1 Tax=Granulicella cerasi TaxID=741063 RepID=A0ABW1ZAU6_9BACT|nr:SRPBCC family protein [Granulicella cerasi]